MKKPIKAPQITLQQLRLIARVTKAAAAAFSGGLNVYNLPTEVSDGQAADMLNLWYKNGMVRLRPGLLQGGGTNDSSKPAKNAALIAKVAALQPAYYAASVTDHSAYAYIPAIFTDCNERGGGDDGEGRNVLTPWVRQVFSPASAAYTNPYQQFKLTDTQLDSQPVYIDYQSPVYTYVEHYAISPSAQDPYTGNKLPYVTFMNPTSGSTYLVICDYTQGLIRWYRLNSSNAIDTAWTGFTDDATYNVMNNLTFTYAKTVKDGAGNAAYSQSTVTSCTMAQYFGGSLSGLGNGTRLVAAGNPAEPNKYRWSAVDDITYWPVDNFNSVGNSGDPVTAMAKANKELVLFKASSIYAVTYNSAQPTNATVVYEPFPQRQLHPFIGCDCPDTVELIQNCLVWLNSDGHVYRLVSYSSADELNVVPLTQNIEPLLKAYASTLLQGATSCDTGSYYIVFIGGEAWAWDYSDTPFSTAKNLNAAQQALAWYHWQFPTVTAPIARAYFTGGYIWFDAGLYYLSENQGTDGGTWFNAYAVSKDIDFGVPVEYKQVNHEWFTVTADDGTTAVFGMKDDAGEMDYQFLITGASANTLTAEYNQTSEMTRHFQAAIRRLAGDTGRFGVSRVVMEATLGHEITGE